MILFLTQVSKNTGLARELQPATISSQLVKPKSETQIERYYFGSVAEKEVAPMEINDAPEPLLKDSLMSKNLFSDRGAKMETPDRGSDSDSKENLVATPTECEKAEGSTSVIISVGSPNSNSNAKFISPCNEPLTKYARY